MWDKRGIRSSIPVRRKPKDSFVMSVSLPENVDSMDVKLGKERRRMKRKRKRNRWALGTCGTEFLHHKAGPRCDTIESGAN